MSRIVVRNDHPMLRSQPIHGSMADMQHQIHSPQPQKPPPKTSQQRQKANDQPRPKKAKIDGNPKHKRLDFKQPKTVSEMNEYRRRRNLNNVMMINRLEKNIGRMEARLQELGFDLSDDALATAPSVLGNLVNVQPSPYSPSSDFDAILNEATSESNSEDMYTDHLEPSQTTGISGIRQTPAESIFPNEEEISSPESLTGFFIPRSLLETPTKGGFQALSHEGIEWISQKSGLTPSLPSNQHNPRTEYDLLEGVSPTKCFCPLPPKEQAMSLLHEYLQNFNSLCPLFEKSKLLRLFNHDRPDIMIQNPARWACINVVLALGIMIRLKDQSVEQPDHKESWLFIKNALGVLNQLCIGPPSLWSIQALLGMAVFLLGTMSAQPCSFLVSTAIRLCHQIGLERTEGGLTFYPEELEQRRRVFWIAYCLDRDISLRFDKPLVQSDDDMSVNLPINTPPEAVGMIPTADQQAEFDTFRACCQLAIIKGQLYKHLYSAAAKDRPLDEIIASVGMLDERLQEWKENLPSKYQPEAQCWPSFPQSQISVILLFLHYSYFNCLIAIHRLVPCRGFSIGMDLAKDNGVYIPPTPSCSSRIFMSASLCASAARASINLMRYMPEGNSCLVGILIHYPIVALMTLSSTIIRNPRHTSRTYDMRLISQVETFLSSLVLNIPNEGMKHLAKYCAEYRSAAEDAVQKAMQFCGG